jgi:hypothetical protein
MTHPRLSAQLSALICDEKLGIFIADVRAADIRFPFCCEEDNMAQNRVIQACETHWETYKNDCSGFVKAVAQQLGISLTGSANDIVDQAQTPPWTVLESGAEAKYKADDGLFVLGGLKALGHGHVVVVVSGPLLNKKYPTAYW